jgi:molybdopterin converting factor small subunit
MIVQVRLYGLFQRYAPQRQPEFQLEIPSTATVEGVLKILKIPLDQDRILLVNGRQSEPERKLEPEDTIVIFSPLSGG